MTLRPETTKLLKENIVIVLSDKKNQRKIPYVPSPRAVEIKTKIKKWDLIKLKHLHSKGNYKRDEKTTIRMGENNSK